MKGRAPTFSLVVPVFRESVRLRHFLSAVRLVMDQVGAPYEILLIDDGSPDDSWQVMVEEASQDSHLRAIRLSRNFGKEAALCAGLDAARGTVFIVMDADMQHPPTLIPEMIQVWRTSGANIVEGVKQEVVGESFSIKWRRGLYYWMMDRLSGFDLKGASDFKLMDHRVRQAWLKLGERNLFFRGMIAWLGFKREQVGFIVPERSGGLSGWPLRRLIRLAMTSIMAFSTIPLRFASVTGLLFSLFAVGVGLDSLRSWWRGVAVPGATTIILLQLIIGAAVLLSIGVIGEYMARIYDEVKGRPRYLISDTVGKSAASAEVLEMEEVHDPSSL
jgi:glycosyltransferase involved in cell wall biosynthesis